MVLTDIAKALGVSKATVSRAINGTGRMSPKTRQRILDYVADMGYTPNASASNLATTRTKNIAYSMPLDETTIMATYFTECLIGVCDKAAASGYDVVVVRDNMDELCRMAASHKVDGIVLSLFNHGNEALEKLTKYKLPLVLVGTTNVPGVIEVSYDARPAFREMTSMLMKKWQMPIGLIVTQKEFPANIGRAEGFRDALTASGIMEPVICWDAYSKDLMVEAMRKLYNKGVYGIVCGDDSICADLLSALSVCRDSEDETERDMARKVRLASFHSNRSLRLFHPEIPTVVMDPMKIGQMAAQMIVYEIEHGGAPVSTFLPYELHFSE